MEFILWTELLCECGDVLLKAYESRSEEGGTLVMINDCGGNLLQTT